MKKTARNKSNDFDSTTHTIRQWIKMVRAPFHSNIYIERNPWPMTKNKHLLWDASYECLQFPITTTYLVFDWWHFASERCKLAANSFINGGPVSKNRFYLSIKRKINWYQSIEMRFSSITTLHNAISDALECFEQFETCVNRFIYTESKHRIVR